MRYCCWGKGGSAAAWEQGRRATDSKPRALLSVMCRAIVNLENADSRSCRWCVVVDQVLAKKVTNHGRRPQHPLSIYITLESRTRQARIPPHGMLRNESRDRTIPRGSGNPATRIVVTMLRILHIMGRYGWMEDVQSRPSPPSPQKQASQTKPAK